MARYRKIISSSKLMHDAALLLASPSKGSGLAILVEMQHRNKVRIYVNTLLVYQTLFLARRKRVLPSACVKKEDLTAILQLE